MAKYTTLEIKESTATISSAHEEESNKAKQVVGSINRDDHSGNEWFGRA